MAVAQSWVWSLRLFMSDESPNKIIQLLEEIRDLAKLDHEKLETILQTNSKQAEEQARRQEELQQRVVAQRRRLDLIRMPLLLSLIGITIYFVCRIMPQTIAREAKLEYSMTNDLAQPPH